MKRRAPTKYWFHPYTDSAFISDDYDEESRLFNQGCEGISKAQYERVIARQATTARLAGVSNNGVHAFTGHRPNKLEGYSAIAQANLVGFASEVLIEAGTEIAIVGMAIGWDQAVADACVNLGIPFVAAIPFIGQEQRWPPASRDRYHRLMGAAQDQIVIHAKKPIAEMQAAQLMHERNAWMVTNSSHLHALWDGERAGGTANCVGYAVQSGRGFTNHWEKWCKRRWLPNMFKEVI